MQKDNVSDLSHGSYGKELGEERVTLARFYVLKMKLWRKDKTIVNPNFSQAKTNQKKKTKQIPIFNNHKACNF